MAKLRSMWWVHFLLPIVLVVTLAAFDGTVLEGHVTVSIEGLWTKKLYSSFSKKVFLLQKTYFNVKALKIFKISSYCHKKICRFFEGRAILKIPSTGFKRNLSSFCWIWKRSLRRSQVTKTNLRFAM